MQNLIVAGATSGFGELWNYLSEKFFAVDMPYLENIKVESNAIFSLRWVIIGITIGIILAAISTVYNKRYYLPQ